MENKINSGCCMYCGQVRQLPRGYDSEPEADSAASLVCTCAGAKAARDKAVRIRDAGFAIDNLFADADAGTAQVLKDLVGLVENGKIEKAAITIEPGRKAEISLTSKGKLKIKRKTAQEHQTEL